MNIRNITVWPALVMVLVAFSAHAQCPVQKTSIFYVNGVDNTIMDTEDSIDKLKTELFSDSTVNPDCVSIHIAYNQSNLLLFDLIEAAEQKTQELNVDISVFWEVFFRLTPIVSGSWMSLLLDDLYLDSDPIRYVVDAQLQEHLALYREALSQGRKVILVSHSQGNFYANEAWNAMTPDERSETSIVSVATPSNTVSDDGPYTTVEEDGIASLFVLALPANASNDEECPDGWYCHGFREWYLSGNHSRNRIVDDIVALLPTEDDPDPIDPCALKGTVSDVFFHPVSNGKVVLSDDSEPYAVKGEYMADTEGNYCVPRGAIADGRYLAEAYAGDTLIESAFVTLHFSWTWFQSFPTPVLM